MTYNMANKFRRCGVNVLFVLEKKKKSFIYRHSACFVLYTETD